MKQFSAFYDTPRFSTVHNSPPRFPPLSQINQAYIVTPHLISSLILFRYSCPVVLINLIINRLTPNDPYMGRTAPLTSKRCILYIYSTNIGTEYFKHTLYSPFFFSSKCSLFHNANFFGSCIIHILYKGCAKIKAIIPAPKG